MAVRGNLFWNRNFYRRQLLSEKTSLMGSSWEWIVKEIFIIWFALLTLPCMQTKSKLCRNELQSFSACFKILSLGWRTTAMQTIDDLTLLVKIAKHRADKRTPFQKAQQRLGRVYNRPVYQNTVTALLIVVGSPSIYPQASRACGNKVNIHIYSSFDQAYSIQFR